MTHQPALFLLPQRHRMPVERRDVGKPPLGEPIDKADADLGRRYPYVTPRRAAEIRRDIEEDRRLLGTTRPPRGRCRCHTTTRED